ncbi:MAG: hypothetical protein NWF02_03430 [Candidatus Bathyarchaeota archaeon]|nr:hypothetical protein [Candidatus Bathyarchaeum sp.]
MEKKRKIKRKSFAAREDFLDCMNAIAKENDLSLYGFVNEAFELTLRANELGINLRMLIDSRELLKNAKEHGYTLGLENLWYDMAELVYCKAKKQALQSWFEAGVWLAKRYVTGESDDSFESFKQDLKDFTWNVPELEMEKEADNVSVRIVSPRLPESYTYLLTSFLEGALQTFGYTIDCKEVARGIIRLDAIKR